MNHRLPMIAIALAAVLAPVAAGQSPCFEWANTFAAPTPGAAGDVQSMAVYDEGQGPKLFVGGSFLGAGGTSAKRLVRWDGSDWSAVGEGLGGPSTHVEVTVEALAVGDLGAGEVLYVGGWFHTAGDLPARNVASWDGTAWSALGTGLRGQTVKDLAFFDDGGGTKLYATGCFTHAGDVPVNGLACWDGVSWTPLGSGLTVGNPAFGEALAVFDDGSGPALYVAGRFRFAAGVPADNVARWDGTTWSAVGDELGPIPHLVRDLHVWDDGTGPALYAAGQFPGDVARWNGSAWVQVGSGVTGNQAWTLAAHDDGAVEALYVGGKLSLAGGVTVQTVARWDGTSWSSVGSPAVQVARTLLSYDAGGGAQLFVGGTPEDLAPEPGPAGRIAAWDGNQWSGVGPTGAGLDGVVLDLCVFEEPGTSRPELVVAGSFQTSGGLRSLARWDGVGWSGIGTPLDTGFVRCCEVYDDGGGQELYVAGSFTLGGQPDFARWDGTSWLSAHGGVWDGPSHGSVREMQVLDLGSGPRLFVSGEFDRAGGVPANNIACWDGTSWSALGAGLSGAAWAMEVFDEGQGPRLFAGGNFFSPASYIARWDGAQWSALATGLSFPSDVYDLLTYDDGGGEALYAAGWIRPVGAAWTGVARWDGAGWSAVGDLEPFQRKIAAFDDGTGPALYAGGRILGCELVRWDGQGWTKLGENYDSQWAIGSLQVYDDGAGDGLYVGGDFFAVGGGPASNLALRRSTGAASCPTSTGTPLCAGDGSGSACPCGNAGALGRGCRAPNGTSARLLGSGDPSSGGVRLRAIDLIPGAPCLLMRSRLRSTPPDGAAFGDGLLCVGGSVSRLATGLASQRQVEFDVDGGPFGGAFYYQLLYRNQAPSFCAPQRFSLTNAYEVVFP